MSEMLLRSLEPGDIDAMAEIERLCFAFPWSRESLASELNNPRAHYCIAQLDGRIAGYAGAWIVLGEAYVTNVAVHPDFRRRGLGRALMQQLIEHAAALDAPDMTLEVRISNQPAIALYESLGFECAGVRKKFYPDGEDALIYWRRPGPESR